MANDPVQPRKKYCCGVCSGWFVALLIAGTVWLRFYWKEAVTISSGNLPVLFWAAGCLGGVAIAFCRRLECREERGFWGEQILLFLWLLAAGMLLYGLFVHSYRTVSPYQARNMKCRFNQRAIWMALQTYADDFGGFYPPENGAVGLNRLLDGKYVIDKTIYICPWNQPGNGEGPLTEEDCDYIYYGGGRAGERKPFVMVMDKPGNHPGHTYCITRSDGSVQFEKRKRREAE